MNQGMTPHRSITFIALVAPIAIFGGVRFLADIGPAPAPAAVPVEALPNPIAPAAQTAPVRRANDWLAAFTLPSSLPSPMLHPEPQAEQAVEQPREVERAAEPQFAVTTIMGSGARAVVSINGKAYRLGGQPASGWRVTAIDGPSKRVTLTGPDGKTLELSPTDKRPIGD